MLPVHPDVPRLAPLVPFPPYAFVPGQTPHPRRSPKGHAAGAPMPAPGLPPERWREDVTYLHGIDLYHAGYLWEAHEAFEAGFFAARERPAHRALLQALVQVSAAVLQARRGVGRGVRLLVRGATTKLRIVAAQTEPGGRLAGLDPCAVLADVERHFAPALDDAVPDDEAARTIGAAPRLDTTETSPAGEACEAYPPPGAAGRGSAQPPGAARGARNTSPTPGTPSGPIEDA